MRRSVGVRAAVYAALAVVTLGGATAGCGSGGGGAAAGSAAPPSVRPEETGPFTKERVAAEFASVVADAGAPAADPEWAAQHAEDSRPGTMGACMVFYRGYGTDGDPVDASTHEALVTELRERGWREAGKRRERAHEDGTVGLIEAVFKKRDWALVAEFRDLEPGYVNLTAMENACVAKAEKPKSPFGGSAP
ncbi:hypothetical protein [Streptomyces sp. NPDC048659]|uniref:hypothetical protein n=1 Tax=Streptomyces sp. NPDC048659 TaxID=3155489 RepID=UPI0034427E09